MDPFKDLEQELGSSVFKGLSKILDKRDFKDEEEFIAVSLKLMKVLFKAIEDGVPTPILTRMIAGIKRFESTVKNVVVPLRRDKNVAERLAALEEMLKIDVTQKRPATWDSPPSND